MNYLPEPITRVERYLARIAGNTDVSIPEKPITRKEHYLAAWAEKSTFQDVTVTGNPAVLDNATGKPFKDLHIYGRSEQMTTTGAQILKLVDREPVTICGLTWQIKNQCISVNGTATEEGNVTDFYICGDRNVYEDADFPEGEITISADLPKDIVMYVVKKGGTVLTYITQQNKDGSFEHISGNKYRIMFRVMKKGAIYDNVIKVMFNTGSTALTWEPYTGGKPSPSPDYPQEIQSAGDDGNLSVIVKNPDNEQMQSVPFSTPNGLPGIQVSVNGNYTDQSGQQWVCDELNFERGVYRQRIKHVNVVFKKEASSSTHSGYRHVAGDIQNMSREHTECLCNIATHSQNAANGTEGVRASGAYNALVLYYENLTLDNVSADVAYILSDPIETSLTATEIAAYKSLRTYRGTTIVEAEDKAGISATYTKFKERSM